ncbi:MAG TPA: PAS domain-containing protein [Steroidobacteraceae bacterium]|nr:PAS domain-containing protein [Steroidobacteraceae bacterium]
MIPDPASDRGPAHGRDGRRGPSPLFLLRGLAWVAAAGATALFASGEWLAAVAALLALAMSLLAENERRRARRELADAHRAAADSERRYRKLFDTLGVGAFCADAAGRLTAVNPGLVALLGCRSEAELLAPDFIERTYIGPGTFQAVLQRARAQGALENIEMRLRRADGLNVVALAAIQAVWNEAGEAVAFEATLVDLTREQLAESQRRSMERRFRRLFDSSAVGMLVGNLRRGTLEEANPALIEAFGLRPSQLPVELEKLVPADQRALHRAVRADLEMQGTAGPVATEYVRADGTRVPVLLSAAMIEPRHGEFVAVLVDRAVEAGARRQAEVLQLACETLLDDAPTPTARFDRAQVMTRCNRALCARLGLAHEPVGRTLVELLGADDPEAVAAAARRALGGESVCLPVVVERGGLRRPQTLSLVPRCSESSAPQGFLAFLTTARAGSEAACAEAGVTPAGTALPDCAGGRRTA